MKYLFIGSHVDDCNLSCGGTISRLVREGNEVWVVSLSREYTFGDLTEEFEASMLELGVHNYVVHNFETRSFSDQRLEILQTLFMLKEVGFDYVFTHSKDDFHADHATVGKESLRAFKHSNLLTYTGSWNTRSHTKNYFVTLDNVDVIKKMKSLELFRSQSNQPYMNKDNIVGELSINGLMCNRRYAEAFETINYTL